MELLIMVNAAKLASAKRITAVIPWYFYVRQDKKSRPREPITAKLVADLLQTAGVDRVLTMDLHAGQVQGFFEIPVDHMTAVPMFTRYVLDLNLGAELAAVSPDTGRAKLAGKFAEMIGGDLVILNKVRPDHNEAKVTTVIGDVEGKVAVMTDDVVDTAGTLVAGATALKEAGATKVYACATHGLFNGDGARADCEQRDRPLDRHRHRSDRPRREAGQRSGALDRRHPRRDDPERLLGRLGQRDLRRGEPALLSESVRPPFVVETERLVLRCWEPDDAAALKVAVDSSLEHLQAWMPWAASEPTTLDEKRQLLTSFRDEFRDGANFVYGVFDRAGDVVGGTGLHPRRGPTDLEIGYWMRLDRTRRGYATEVTAVLTRVAIELLGIERVVVLVDPRNEPSLGVPRKLGFTEGETLDGMLLPLPGDPEKSIGHGVYADPARLSERGSRRVSVHRPGRRTLEKLRDDVGESRDAEREMPLAREESSSGAGNRVSEPPAVRERDHPIVVALPDGHRHGDRRE